MDSGASIPGHVEPLRLVVMGSAPTDLLTMRTRPLPLGADTEQHRCIGADVEARGPEVEQAGEPGAGKTRDWPIAIPTWQRGRDMNRRRRIVYETGALIGLLLVVSGVGAAVAAAATLVVVWELPPINRLAVYVWVGVDAVAGACGAVWWLTRPLRLGREKGAPV